MTKVTFFKRNGVYIGFDAEGHAGFADKGEDIVCAAISILTINTVNSLEEINHEDVDASMKDGNLEVRLKSNREASSQVLIESLILGLNSIRKEYGNKYVKVVYKEENANVKA